jgi:hypothetical protein
MKQTLTFQDLRHIKVSKHRNSQSKSLEWTDTSGKKITGHPIRHFQQASILQQERFNNKFEAFSQLNQGELKTLFETQPKDKVKGNTDKSALIQAYYNSSFEAFKAQSEADLEAINGTALENLDLVQKQALLDAKDILTKTKETEQ